MSCPLDPLFSLESDALADPFRLYDGARQPVGVMWSDTLDGFAVTSHEAVRAVLGDAETYSSAHTTGKELPTQTRAAIERLSGAHPEFAERLRRTPMGARSVLLNADSPPHAHQRSIVNRAFSLRKIRAAEPHIRAIVRDLVDEIGDPADVDFVSQFAVPLPVRVIADQLGVPSSEAERFKLWSDALTASISDPGLDDDSYLTVLSQQLDFFEFAQEMIERRRKNPTEDMLSTIAHGVDDQGRQLSDREVTGIVAQFMVAGNETTTRLLTFMALQLATEPDLMVTLETEPQAVRDFIEEVLRVNSPVQGLFRSATRDAELQGVAIPAGSTLWVSYGAANRDPAQFEDPASLCPSREDVRRHVAFGSGAHQCIGQTLARTEARIALDEILSRFSRIELTAPVPAYQRSFIFRGLDRLHVALVP